MRSKSPCKPGAARTWDAARYDSCGAFVWEHGADLVELLAPGPRDRILDVGCGTGHLTARMAESGADVLGIDASESMVLQARSNYPQLRFEVLDALKMDLGPQFDAVFSNAVLHWITEPVAAAAAIFDALKPHGRFAAEFGGKGNISAIVEAVLRARESIEALPLTRAPWYFPSVDEYTSLLEGLGFTVVCARLFDRPTRLGEGDGTMITWLQMFAEPLLNDLTDSQRHTVCKIAEDDLRAKLVEDGVWIADYVRLRVMAKKPG